MSNEIFILDTDEWVWKECSLPTSSTAAPSPRAAPCWVALDETSCLLFGGASVGGGGLHGCSDTWLLELEDQASESGSSSTVAHWKLLHEDESARSPPGRNAATLTPLPSSFTLKDHEDGNESPSSQYFLLSGGWYPFRTTYGDNYVLKVTK